MLHDADPSRQTTSTPFNSVACISHGLSLYERRLQRGDVVLEPVHPPALGIHSTLVGRPGPSRISHPTATTTNEPSHPRQNPLSIVPEILQD